jgi:hypothetical protein
MSSVFDVAMMQIRYGERVANAWKHHSYEATAMAVCCLIVQRPCFEEFVRCCGALLCRKYRENGLLGQAGSIRPG